MRQLPGAAVLEKSIALFSFPFPLPRSWNVIALAGALAAILGQRDGFGDIRSEKAREKGSLMLRSTHCPALARPAPNPFNLLRKCPVLFNLLLSCVISCYSRLNFIHISTGHDLRLLSALRNVLVPETGHAAMGWGYVLKGAKLGKEPSRSGTRAGKRKRGKGGNGRRTGRGWTQPSPLGPSSLHGRVFHVFYTAPCCPQRHPQHSRS